MELSPNMIVGLVAGSLTSVAAIPQVVKAIRSKSTKDLSLWQPLLLIFGVGLWMIYGAMIKDLPLLLANTVPLCANLALVVMKLKEQALCKE